jgi:hypothetical protein
MYLLHLAIAVGRDIFRPDTNTLVELMIQIQSRFFGAIDEKISNTVDPADTQLGNYLIATWAKVC